jgi:hypothetical protein
MVPGWNQIEEWLKELELFRQTVETASPPTAGKSR